MIEKTFASSSLCLDILDDADRLGRAAREASRESQKSLKKIVLRFHDFSEHQQLRFGGEIGFERNIETAGTIVLMGSPITKTSTSIATTSGVTTHRIVADAQNPIDVLKAGLVTPGALTIDLRAPGQGKTHDLIQVLAQGELPGRTAVAAQSHKHHQNELAPKLKAVGVLPVIWPRPICPEEKSFAAPTKAGWSYGATVCKSCRSRPNCSLVRAQERARVASQALIQHTHLRVGIGSVGDIQRLVIDEDPLSSLLSSVVFTLPRLNMFRTRALKVFGHDEESRTDLKAIATVLGQIELALRNSKGAEVLGVDPPQTSDWRRLLGKASTIAQRMSYRMGSSPPTNLLPLIGQIVRDWNEHRTPVILRSGKRFVGLVRKHVPLELPVAVLDATADPEILAKALGRDPECVRTIRGPAPGLAIRKVRSGGLRSRKKLKREEHWIAKDAKTIAKHIIELQLPRGSKVGLITYQDNLEPLVAEIKRVITNSPRNNGRRPPMPKFVKLYWHHLRGTNAFKEKDCKLVVIHGTPNPTALTTRKLAWLLGASVEELREKPCSRRLAGVAVVAYEPGSIMEQARHYLVASEMKQAIGRATRGPWTAKHGALLLSSYPYKDGAAAQWEEKQRRKREQEELKRAERLRRFNEQFHREMREVERVTTAFEIMLEEAKDAPDAASKFPATGLGAYALFVSAVRSRWPHARLARPTPETQKKCAALLQEFGQEILYEMILVLVHDYELFQPAGVWLAYGGTPYPTLSQLRKNRETLARLAYKGVQSRGVRYSRYAAHLDRRRLNLSSVSAAS